MKQEIGKKTIIEQLQKTPILEIALNKTEVSRRTFYRWKQNDSKFAKEVDEAMTMGKSLISDVAESQLITAIKSGDMRGIIFWLKHKKDEYRNRVELSGSIGQVREDLTEDEVEILHQALKLAGFEKNIIDEEETQK